MSRRTLRVCFTFAVVALVAGCGGGGKETLQKVDLPLFTGWFWHLISFLAIVGVASFAAHLPAFLAFVLTTTLPGAFTSACPATTSAR